MCHNSKMSCYVDTFDNSKKRCADEDENMFLRIVPKDGSNVDQQTGGSRDEIERINRTLWVVNYANDIYKTLQEDELKRRRMHFQSAQMQYRPTLLQLLRTVSEVYKLNRCTLHLSVYLLDRFTDCFTIRVDKLNLVALVCLRIAAQVEDSDPSIPKYSDLNRIVSFCYHWNEFKTVERKILVTMDFGLLRPTTAHFVEYFAGSFLSLEDYASHKASYDVAENNKAYLPLLSSYDSYEQMLRAHTILLFELADLTLICHRLSNTRPSMLAASCIACVRFNSGLTPVWTPHLMKLTTYDEATIKMYIDMIITMYEVHKQRQNTFDSYLETQEQCVPSTPKQDAVKDDVEWNTPDSGISNSSVQDKSANLPVLVQPLDDLQQTLVAPNEGNDHCEAVENNNQQVVRNNNNENDDGVVADQTDDNDDSLDYQKPAKRMKIM